MEHSSSKVSDHPLADDAELVFRAVDGGKVRRGIRLEAIYWRVLREIADLKQKKIGAVIGDVLADAPEPANTTSLLRVYCLRWALDALAAERKVTDPLGVVNLVRASPSPAFALGLDKRLLAYNQSLLDYIQARFSYGETGLINSDLRLALDVQVAALAATLKDNGNRPLEVGFVVGFGGRRLRGKLNALLAPASGENIVLCYLLP
ncbi:UNVERIFIED_ORG: ribbon-helix-helix domain-containing protein (plasmid) [Roseateles sp. XES5]|nr:ribbon-helix-helix domain-containing protein [Roseateles sp. XES5]